MQVPYAIVKGKARLGLTVNKKTSAVAALTEVRSEDSQALSNVVSAVKSYNETNKEAARHWGGGLRGPKSKAKLIKRARRAGQDVKSVHLEL